MKTFTAILALFAGSSLAASVCPPGLLSGSPQCCSTDVLGVADLDCEIPNRQPMNGADFARICSEDNGRAAMCCSVPVAGQALVCSRAIGA